MLSNISRCKHFCAQNITISAVVPEPGGPGGPLAPQYLADQLTLYQLGRAEGTKQKSYKCDNQLITWLTGITRPAGSCNLVTLKTNFVQYKNFVCLVVLIFGHLQIRNMSLSNKFQTFDPIALNFHAPYIL